MDPEVSLLSEVWDTVKPLLPKKEHLYVAETLYKLDISEISVYKNEFDSVMKAVILDKQGIEDTEEEMEW